MSLDARHDSWAGGDHPGFAVRVACAGCAREKKSVRIKQLEQQIEELKPQAVAAGDAEGDEKEPVKPPAWVKANLPIDRKRKKPGRKKGHEPALWPKPRKIDQNNR